MSKETNQDQKLGQDELIEISDSIQEQIGQDDLIKISDSFQSMFNAVGRSATMYNNIINNSVNDVGKSLEPIIESINKIHRSLEPMIQIVNKNIPIDPERLVIVRKYICIYKKIEFLTKNEKTFVEEYSHKALSEITQEDIDQLNKIFFRLVKLKKLEDYLLDDFDFSGLPGANLKLFDLPDKLKISQTHSINTLKTAITGAKDKRNTQRITVTIDEYEEIFTAREGQRKGFKTEVNIHEFGTIKHLINDKMAKLLDVIFHNLDSQGASKGFIQFPTYHYMEYRGLKITDNSIKEIEKELRPLLKALHNISITSTEGKRSYSFVRPFSRGQLRKGNIIVGFDRIFVDSINKRYFEMPKQVGTLRPTAYNIASYMYMYCRKSNKNEFTLTNETLYEYSGLPRYDEVNQGGYKREIGKAIVEPYQKALYKISEILDEHIEITESEFEPSNWESFLKAKVKIKLPNVKQTVISVSKSRQKAKKAKK